ncbi:hypothetical protein DFJ63DRAFT_264229 [Scheffersomyces coipomensis]|uniref:uncharacterized protein n=1 Tax=Scheffersomyces coipomensis TaxID=1788519 RepID=UPI00315CAD92
MDNIAQTSMEFTTMILASNPEMPFSKVDEFKVAVLITNLNIKKKFQLDSDDRRYTEFLDPETQAAFIQNLENSTSAKIDEYPVTLEKSLVNNYGYEKPSCFPKSIEMITPSCLNSLHEFVAMYIGFNPRSSKRDEIKNTLVQFFRDRKYKIPDSGIYKLFKHLDGEIHTLSTSNCLYKLHYKVGVDDGVTIEEYLALLKRVHALVL